MTSDGTNTYQWDAENRLIQINYPGTGNNSAFIYDAFNEQVKLTETSGGTLESTKQFVWCGLTRCEARSATGAISAQYFQFGESISATSYVYTQDQLGSIRELTNSSGVIQAQYAYDPYGRVTKLAGSASADFQYAGYYFHQPSGLNFTSNRTYSSLTGTWLSRDPIEEDGGTNLYDYVENDPIDSTDPSGLKRKRKPPPPVCPLRPIGPPRSDPGPLTPPPLEGHATPFDPNIPPDPLPSPPDGTVPHVPGLH